MTDRRSLDDGFAGAIPQSDDDERVALRTGLLSLDANVLLNFYRYSPNAQRALVDVLRAAGDRVWVSHQAAREFWRNRCAAIDGRTGATEQLRTALEDTERKSIQSVDLWAKQRAVPEEIKEQVRRKLSEGFADARESIDIETEGAGQVSYASSNDSVLQVLRELLDDRVGPELPPDEHELAVAEAHKRLAEKRPPGYLDEHKAEIGNPDGGTGDYLVWRQSLVEATQRNLPLVIVTGDEKEDWWWKHRSSFMGPRSELVREFAEHSDRGLFMLRPIQLIQHASVLDVTVSEDAASDVARASSNPGPPQWSLEAIDELLARLDREGAVQADVIRFAASAGGTIDRDKIFEIGDYDEDRMLRGFTRPTARIARDLQAEGYLDYGVEPMLTPIYDGVIATRFRVPGEVVEHFSSRANSDPADEVERTLNWLVARGHIDSAAFDQALARTRSGEITYNEVREIPGMSLARTALGLSNMYALDELIAGLLKKDQRRDA